MDSIQLHLKLPLKFSMKFVAGVGKNGLCLRGNFSENTHVALWTVRVLNFN